MDVLELHVAVSSRSKAGNLDGTIGQTALICGFGRLWKYILMMYIKYKWYGGFGSFAPGQGSLFLYSVHWYVARVRFGMAYKVTYTKISF